MAKKDEAETEVTATKAPDPPPDPASDEAPPSQIEKGGVTAYSVERLLTDGAGLVGYEPHVIAGAVYGTEADYLTPDEVRDLVEPWLEKEDATVTTATAPAEG